MPFSGKVCVCECPSASTECVCVCEREGEGERQRERERERNANLRGVCKTFKANQLLGKRGDMRITVRGVSVRAGERRERECECECECVARRMLSNEAV